MGKTNKVKPNMVFDKNKNLLIYKWHWFIIGAMLLFACSSHSNYISVPLSSFTLNNDLLKDKDLVEVISFSGMPDNNLPVVYFIHLLIVSKQTNDTFNLLTYNTAGLLNDEDKEMNYFSQNSSMYQMMLTSLRTVNGKVNNETIDKVMIDKNLEESIHNNHPTVIGVLGTVKKNE